MGVDVNELNLIDRINLYTKMPVEITELISLKKNESGLIESWELKLLMTLLKSQTLSLAYCKENESETDNSYADFNFATAENGSDDSDDDMSMTAQSPVQMMDSDEEMESDSPSPSEEGEESGEESDSKVKQFW